MPTNSTHITMLNQLLLYLNGQGGNDGLGVDQAGVTQVVQAYMQDRKSQSLQAALECACALQFVKNDLHYFANSRR